jgi:thiamine biosynthesis lipoprotein
MVDPHAGVIAIGARSASVVGPDWALCDARATALMVNGRDAVDGAAMARYIRFLGHQSMMMTLHGGATPTWFFGPRENSSGQFHI